MEAGNHVNQVNPRGQGEVNVRDFFTTGIVGCGCPDHALSLSFPIV